MVFCGESDVLVKAVKSTCGSPMAQRGGGEDKIGIGRLRTLLGTLGIGIRMGSCNACSTRFLPAPGRGSPPGSFIRVVQQSKLIQDRNLVDCFVLARPRGKSRGGGGGWSRVAMEGVAEEAFRHVRRPAAVADLEPSCLCSRSRVVVAHQPITDGC
jgi:hypothetical protein